MNSLARYLTNKGESESAFAKRTGIPQSTVWRIANQKTQISPENALRIEQATHGQVTRMELLYPDGGAATTQRQTKTKATNAGDATEQDGGSGQS